MMCSAGAQGLYKWPIIRNFFFEATVESKAVQDEQTLLQVSDIGLNLDGLDKHVVEELRVSYMRNMWRIYPFLDAQKLKEQTGHFVCKYLPAKRKHLDDSCMEDAIVLLVLALGRVLQEEGFLLQTPSSPAEGPGRSNTGQRHIKIYPGFAYFAFASKILGNNDGEHEIIHAQAFLLAGLYLGQLGRVIQSRICISKGSSVAKILRAENFKNLEDPNDPDPRAPGQPELNNECTIISFLCWSIELLKADLRPGLESPSTKLTVRRPSRLVGMDTSFEMFRGHPSIEETDVLWYFSTAIQLLVTTTLDKSSGIADIRFLSVERMLSTSLDPVPKKSSTLPWADANASDRFMALQDHRQILERSKYGWNDGDAPPKDLLQACLRAKFSEATSIILRPFIFHALMLQDDSKYSADQLRGWLKTYDLPQEEKKDMDRLLRCCKSCIDSAMDSILAFDGVANPVQMKRFRVPNIHSTATDQFDNMLVLTAVYKSWLHPFVEVEKLQQLMNRTICLLQSLCQLISIHQINLNVLKVANEVLTGPAGPPTPPVYSTPLTAHL